VLWLVLDAVVLLARIVKGIISSVAQVADLLVVVVIVQVNINIKEEDKDSCVEGKAEKMMREGGKE
jgi:hypothetical protein